MTEVPWPFYVYEILSGDECVYVGKGTGRRLKNQIRCFNAPGQEIARFADENDAFEFERVLIAEREPRLNRNRGGLGRKRQFDSEIAFCMPHRFFGMLDDLRREEKDIPSRAEMIRRLIERGGP